MPPKPESSSKGQGPSKKTEIKKKERVIEDKTFGLKNKKGAKQQKFIQQVQKQVHSGGNNPKKIDGVVGAKKPEDEIGLIIKPVQKIDKGADPKSILCAFFKQGTCGKGDKCKFSHDLTIERKAEKRSLYCDDDSERGEKDADTMDLWDEAKLQEVVNKKHSNDSTTNKTDIICKHFLEAVEKAKYGWFWECPNSTNCIYRHALPPGFVLKKDKKLLKEAEEENKIGLEEWIETERHKLNCSSAVLTKVNLSTFIAWKKRKIMERKETARKVEEKKMRDFKEGNRVGLSGREMFQFNPDLGMDDEEDNEDEGVVDYNYDGEREEGGSEDLNEYKEVELDDYENMYENMQEQVDKVTESLQVVPIDDSLFLDDDFN